LKKVLIAILCLPFLLSAQKSKKFKVSSISIKFPVFGGSSTNSTLETMQNKSLSSNNLLFDDYSNFTGFSLTSSDGFGVGFSLGLNAYNRKKSIYNKNVEVRVGLTYKKMNLDYASFSQESATLRSVILTPSSYIITDSTYSNSANFNEFSDELQITSMYLIKTNSKRRAGAYAGVAMRFGFAFKSEIKARKQEGANIEIEGQVNGYDFNGYDYFTISNNTELIKSSKSIFANGTLLLGASLKLAKNIKYLNKTELFLQYEGGIKYRNWLKAKSNFNFSVVATIGISYYL